MSHCTATQPVIARTDLHAIEPKTTQFQITVVPGDAPWLYSALAELRDLKQSGGLIPGFGDFRISDSTDLNAKVLLTHMDLKEDIPSPVISVFSGGGVSITWHLGRKELGFKVFPGGPSTFVKVVDDEILDDGEVALAFRSPQPTELVKWLLEPPS